jgi:hypothetical protein
VDKLFAVMVLVLTAFVTIKLSDTYDVPPKMVVPVTDKEQEFTELKLALAGSNASFSAEITLFKILMFVPAINDPVEILSAVKVVTDK